VGGAVRPRRFEYRIESLTLAGGADAAGEAASELDRLGADGWEAVGVAPSHANGRGLHVETTRFLVLLKRAME
jgi:hypothetical protein